MRLKVTCELSDERFPLNFRRKILMLIKTGMKQAHPEVFEELYGTNKQKDFTFAVYFKEGIFGKDGITVKGRQLIINFSTGNPELAIVIYNSFVNLKNRAVKITDLCDLSVRHVDIVKIAPIEGKSVVFKTLSPIVCRDHNRETFKDWFFSFEDGEFVSLLKRNLLIKLQDEYGEFIAKDIENMKITPLKMKKTVALHYDIYIACSLGLIEVEAPKYLLEHMLTSGIGSLTGTGFGMVMQA
ncbi:CRISPR-associated endoribonuclease Cas6 [Listeria grandensis]|uniref:CRISPR-associated endoribonuclease Cas6 n=1 Tax=Listeria grandensis TaxID=1494963 RepID=UPI00164E986C|nr:CRISPR-associated endoribonuclease Cas6 [Listeria grandensis]MBC6314499.1 CRISPR-associated endoribonuclease Cas6 [Listeria grandensis]